MQDTIRSHLEEAQRCLTALINEPTVLKSIEDASQLLGEAFKGAGAVISCGNGGSMCDAMHFAEELSGRFRDDRPPLPASAISDGAYLTCVGNDYGFEQVFARYVLAHGRRGDVFFGISTSGKSANVIQGALAARSKGLKVIILTGRDAGPLISLADVAVVTKGGRYADRVQELHIKVIHILIDLIEKQLFGQPS